MIAVCMTMRVATQMSGDPAEPRASPWLQLPGVLHALFLAGRLALDLLTPVRRSGKQLIDLVTN